MARNTIQSRIRSSLSLAQALAHFGGKVSAGMEARFGDGSPGTEGAIPGQERMLDCLGKALLAAREELMERDADHQKQVRRGRAVLERRDGLDRELRQTLVRIRRVLRGLMGREAAETFLDLGGRTSQDPVVLVSQALRVRRCLETADLPEVDGQELSQRLGRLAEALDEACEQAAHARRLEERTSYLRNKAAAALDEVYRPTRQLFRAMGQLAGVPAVEVDLRRQVTKVGRPRSRETSAAAEGAARPQDDGLAGDLAVPGAENPF